MTKMWSPGLLLCSCLLWAMASALSYYSLMHPRGVRPGGTISVSVQLNGTKGPVDFRLELMDHEGNRMQTGKSFRFDGDGFFSAELECESNLKKPDYPLIYLRMQAWGGMTFDRFVTLHWRARRITVFLQTDKREYLPGSTVRFRTLAMRQDTSVSTEKMDIVITDPLGNQVAKYTRPPRKDLLFEGELHLPKDLRLGEYAIQSTIKGAKRIKYFTVKKIDRSDFYMRLWFPKASVFDTTVKAKISARYLTGMNVRGTGSITMSVPRYSYYYYSRYYYWSYYYRYSSYYYSETTENFKLDNVGNATVTFKMSAVRDMICRTYYSYYYYYHYSYCNRYSYYSLYRYIKFSATIRDSNSFDKVTREKWMYLTAEKSYLRFVAPTSRYFKPGLPLTVHVQDVRSSGKPNPRPKSTNITFTVSYYNSTYCSRYYYYYYRYRTYHTLLTESAELDDETKTATLAVDKIPEGACYVQISATNGKQKWAYRGLSRFYSPSGTYLHTEMRTDPQVGKTRRVTILSNKEFQNYMIMGYSKGGQVFAEKVTRKVASTKASYAFNVTTEMVPNLRVVTFLEQKPGKYELIADAISQDIEYSDYTVTLSVDKSRRKVVKPGEAVRVKATSIPGSMVFVMGKDNRDLTTANEIKAKDVYMALMVHDASRRHMDLLTGYSNDVADLIRYSGLELTTSLYVPGRYYYYYYSMPRHYRWWSYYYYNSYRYRYFYDCRRYRLAASPPERTQRLAVTPANLPDETYLETWLFSSLKYNAKEGTLKPFKPIPKAPDSLQTLEISGFAVHEERGIVFAQDTVEIVTTRDIFLTMYMPQTAVLGEVVCIRALVHNAGDEDQTAEVKIIRSEQFDVIVVTKDGNTTTETPTYAYITKTLGTVEAGVIKSTQFCIKPKTLGDVTVTLASNTKYSGTIKVRPAGVERSKTFSVAVEVTPSSNFSATTDLSLPSDVQDGSVRLKVDVCRDPMGLTMEHVDRLVNLPNGNGEQNLAVMAPAVYLINYLERTSLSGVVSYMDTLRKALQTSYHQQMMYQSFDGSFREFGNNDEVGNTWLSAYVVKVFSQAHDLGSKFINIELDLLGRAIGFVTQYQNADGSFIEHGRKTHPMLQTGQVRLTAFVAIALAEAKKALSKRDHPVARARVEYALPKAVVFLENKLASSTEKYDLAIMAYALALAKSSNASDAISMLKNKLTTNGNMKYLDGETKAVNIEMTAYALMALLQEREDDLALNVYRYLHSVRGPNGGFVSTHDTVVATEALAKLTDAASGRKIDVTVNVGRTVGSFVKTRQLSLSGSKDVEPKDLAFAWEADHVPSTVTVEGTASLESGQKAWAFVTVTAYYTVASVGASGGMQVVTKTYSGSSRSFRLKTCVSRSSASNRTTEHDPVIMTVVRIPTGYALNKTSSTYGYLHRALENGEGEEVVLYHSEGMFKRRRRCSNLRFNINAKVAYLKDFYVRTFNAMNPSEEEDVSEVSMEQYKVCDVVSAYDACDE